MNILIQNENSKILESLNINIIKTLNGSFSKEELTIELSNLVYNKVIIDITAISNYYDSFSVTELLSLFDSEKVIILLNNSELVNSSTYINTLIKSGYYNFTRNSAGINYLIENPNSLEDVKNYLELSSKKAENNQVQKTEIPANIYIKNNKQKIIGLVNLTEHAGATTLMYMMVKQLRDNYAVKGIEMHKQDSVYFRDNDLSVCMTEQDLKSKLKTFSNIEAIIIDLNDYDSTICDEVLYIIEPGIIRLNKLLKKDPVIHNKLIGKKIILNRSVLKNEELNNFEFETKLKIFSNMPNFNDRSKKIQLIDILLIKLGFNKQQTGSFMSIFK